MIKTGVYKILNNSNNKVYIGSATDIKKRWRDHKWHLKHNKHHNSHLQLSWNKYGAEVFEFIIILECLIEELLEKETEHMMKYNSLDNKYGYNVNKPQKIFLNRKCRQETKDFISQRMMGSKNPMYGKFGNKHPKFGSSPSFETKNKLSLTKLGIPTNRRSNVKLTEKDVLTIRNMYFNENVSQLNISKRFSVAYTTINAIVKGKTWAKL